MKTEHQRQQQWLRNAALRADKLARAQRASFRFAYPIRPAPTYPEPDPESAAGRAIVRDGQRLTDARVAIFQVEFVDGRQQRRRRAMLERKVIRRLRKAHWPLSRAA